MAKKAEPKAKTIPVCGHQNKHYFHGEDELGNALPGVLKCSLAQGHAGDHYSENDEKGNFVGVESPDGTKIPNGYWSNQAG